MGGVKSLGLGARAGPGLDSLPAMVVMENHDEAYGVWRSAGLREKILVHIDAHDDLAWTPDPGTLNIGNFLSLALQEGIIREVIWVVPDQTWESIRTRKPLRRRLKKLTREFPAASPRVKVEAEQISLTLLEKPVRVCSLDHLPPFLEKVLLDIDTDFFTISRACSRSDQHRDLPWCWPGELAARLKAAGLQADLITIAYSVEGGYTPVKWKYLADELSLFLQPSLNSDLALRGLELIRAGAQAAQQGDLNSAERLYLQAQELLPDAAAPPYHLAHLYTQMERPGQARQFYRRALALDPSYKTPYNSGGLWYYYGRRLREAEAEHRRTLLLDPEDAYAHLGLGKIAARRRHWPEAEAWLRKSLALNDQLVDTYRALGKVLSKQKRRREAIAAYERSLKLTLAGHKPLKAPIFSDPGEHLLTDPDHSRVHILLARLYEQEGDTDTAITGYRMGIALGDRGFWPCYRLACLYFKRRRWQEAGMEIWQALKNLPQDGRQTAARYYYRVKLALQNRFGPGFAS
jgi:tetratricopeptide (TPR) repeat protein